MRISYDFIVAGAGSMGSATAYYLAKQGFRVLAIDQFDPPHDQGSHAGQSRIIRKAYFEHPDYVPLLHRSYELWKAFEEEIGERIYYETGIVYFGDASHPTLAGVRSSAKLYDVKLEVLDPQRSSVEFPEFNLPASFQTLVEPEAGFVRPEFAIGKYLTEAKRLGARLLVNERVLSWTSGPDGVSATTDKGVHYGGKLILTAGSWMKKLVSPLDRHLRVTRQTLAWVSPKDPDAFALGNFPCWFIEDPQLGMFYGFPILPYESFGGPIGLKIASHRPGETVDPDAVDRKTLAEEQQAIQTVLSKYFHDAGQEIITLKTCLYTYSPDENFIIDILPDTYKRVVVAAGFSGHGFKFVPVVGELLSQLATGKAPTLKTDFLGMSRLHCSD